MRRVLGRGLLSLLVLLAVGQAGTGLAHADLSLTVQDVGGSAAPADPTPPWRIVSAAGTAEADDVTLTGAPGSATFQLAPELA
jgi:hypothetical protein